MRVERIGDAMLHLGDCREVMAAWPTCLRVDAVVTDPPYGVGFAGKVTKNTVNRHENTYADDEVTFRSIVLPAIGAALDRAARGAVFCGTRRLQEYPPAKEIGGIVCPAGSGRSSWGFGCMNPVLFYGNSPHVGSRPTVRVSYHPGMHITGEAAGNSHPCPKPIEFMLWAVEMATKEGQTALDPFMGSGTTGVACANLGRKFVGIEIDPGYFDIACRRIEEAYRQPRLFDAHAQKIVQPSMFDAPA